MGSLGFQLKNFEMSTSMTGVFIGIWKNLMQPFCPVSTYSFS